MNAIYKLCEQDVEAEVILIHKSGPEEVPKNYRPISLLNTDYKIMTKAIKNLMDIQIGHLIPKEQLARKGIWGTNTRIPIRPPRSNKS